MADRDTRAALQAIVELRQLQRRGTELHARQAARSAAEQENRLQASGDKLAHDIAGWETTMFRPMLEPALTHAWTSAIERDVARLDQDREMAAALRDRADDARGTWHRSEEHERSAKKHYADFSRECRRRADEALLAVTSELHMARGRFTS